MFTYVKLQNFKSLLNLEFNLCNRYKEPKNLILIYGTNGVGKSNLISAFGMLNSFMHTMDVRDMIQDLLTSFQDDEDQAAISAFIRRRMKDVTNIIRRCRTIGADAPTSAEFGFQLGGNSGSYLIEFDDSQIIHEKLVYKLEKNKTVCLDITPDKTSISSKLFQDKNEQKHIKELLKQFWGKHTMLSIMLHEMEDKTADYMSGAVNSNFIHLIQFLATFSCRENSGDPLDESLSTPGYILNDLCQGTIPLSKKKVLSQTEHILNQIFQKLDPKVIRVSYEIEENDDEAAYSLKLTKLLGGKEVTVDSVFESTGTKAILEMLPYILLAVDGHIAIIDEFDAGIHDLLIQALTYSAYYNVLGAGQLILTTHNTHLMECINKESIYVLNQDSEGNKEIHCILHYDNKIGEKSNIRKQYLDGAFSPNAVSERPVSSYIPFRRLLDTLTPED